MYRVFHIPSSEYLCSRKSKTDHSINGPFPPETVFVKSGWYAEPVPMSFFESRKQVSSRIALLIYKNINWKTFVLNEFELHNFESFESSIYTVEELAT